MGSVPSTFVAVVVLLFAIAPGYLYRKVLRRYVLQDDRSAAVELVELFAIGALTTLMTVIGVLAIGELNGVLLSPREAVQPSYLAGHPWEVLFSAGAVMLSSSLLCACWGWLTGRRSGSKMSRVHEGTTWTQVLTHQDSDREPYLAVELTDGRLVEGFPFAVSVEDQQDKRFIALQGPLAVTGPGDAPRERSRAHFILLPGSLIKVVHGRYVSRDELSSKPVGAEQLPVQASSDQLGDPR